MMRYLLYKIILVLGLLFFITTNGYTQNHSRLCICFRENTKYINANFSEDSSFAAFNIIREGFETEQKREEARIKWSKEYPTSEPPISFYYRYLSNKKPEKINSIKNTNCLAWVKLEKFRKKGFKYPEGAGGSKVYLIQKLENGRYLKWDTILMANE